MDDDDVQHGLRLVQPRLLIPEAGASPIHQPSTVYPHDFSDLSLYAITVQNQHRNYGTRVRISTTKSSDA
jgi:hypothetical protein